jgi:hypothetical protein
MSDVELLLAIGSYDHASDLVSNHLRAKGSDLRYNDLTRDEKFSSCCRSLVKLSSFEKDCSLKGIIHA